MGIEGHWTASPKPGSNVLFGTSNFLSLFLILYILGNCWGAGVTNANASSVQACDVNT